MVLKTNALEESIWLLLIEESTYHRLLERTAFGETINATIELALDTADAAFERSVQRAHALERQMRGEFKR